uniref:CSON014145 protein n=1 Tax=Culicoides sonorensis TaxID=179676 RepID=A0A336M9P7_CULSO
MAAFAIGIDLVHDGSLSVIIKRNTSIPVKTTKRFETVKDFQERTIFNIYEGERKMVKDNHFVGSFTIDGIPPLPRGFGKIEETFEIDENGIFKASAYVPLSGTRNSITITNKSRLSKDDAIRLATEAARFRQEDEAHEIRLAAFNSFERRLYDIKRQIGTLPERKQKIGKSYVDTLTKWLDENSLAKKEDFEEKKAELEEFWRNFQK